MGCMDIVDDVVIPVSAGELIDRVTILQIKSERIQDPAKLSNVQRELTELRLVCGRRVDLQDPQIESLQHRLRQINELLWDTEDAIRRCERLQDFGPAFIRLARSVYHQNDERADVKRRINQLVGSRLVEEKQYDEYLTAGQPATTLRAAAAELHPTPE